MKKQLFAGKFEIQGEISKGQTGTIYYGYDIGLRQEVAIKVYHSHINGRLIRGKSFIEKSKPLLLIDHPNLIKIFKVDEEDDSKKGQFLLKLAEAFEMLEKDYLGGGGTRGYGQVLVTTEDGRTPLAEHIRGLV